MKKYIVVLFALFVSQIYSQDINTFFAKADTKKKRVEVSEIMKWYKEDFTMNSTTEIDFINKYRTEKIPKNYMLTYFSYNWKLNAQ